MYVCTKTSREACPNRFPAYLTQSHIAHSGCRIFTSHPSHPGIDFLLSKGWHRIQAIEQIPRAADN
jgi:hypothetical protein